MSQMLVDMAWDGQDADATLIICSAWKSWQETAPDRKDIPDVYKKIGALRANLDFVPDTLRSMFAEAADLQDAWIASSEKIVTHGQPHHYNLVEDEGEGWKLIKPDSVLAPVAYDMAFVLTNPYNFERSLEDNIALVSSKGRVEQQMQIISDETDIPETDLARATLGHCFTVAAKRYWSIANRGGIEPGQVDAAYFMEIARTVAPAAGFNFK